MKLLQPIGIKNLELKNRIVMSPMHLGFSEDGFVNERVVDFYHERAKGGVGLILVGGCTITPFPGYWSKKANRMESGPEAQSGACSEMAIGDDKFIPGHRKLVDSCHEAGAKIGAQLFHTGRNDRHESHPIAPSKVPSPLVGTIPREMTVDDIKEVIGHFASAALRVKEAGYDMVEVCGGYLIAQFFSPIVNYRTDEYGGSLENRMRFGEEVVRAVRRAVGADFPLSVRIHGNDFMVGGNNNEDACQFARRFQEAGADLFNVNGGWHETRVPQITMNVPAGAYAYLAKGIRQAVDVPVIACHRINDPLVAEKILLEGNGDLVGMARALMADPQLPKKVMEGRLDEIRKCLGCNQGCLDRVLAYGQDCSCLVNARVGREGKTEVKPSTLQKKILVIGGGPAGMEAARVAALRGYAVTLWEKDRRLGGRLLQACAVPGRGELFSLVEYLQKSLWRLGVKVELEKYATVEEIESLSPDAVVVATGSMPIIPAIPGIESPHVIGAEEVLSGQMELGHKVVIIGGGGVGCEVGLFVAEQGTINSDIVKFLLVNEAETVEKIKELSIRGTKEVVIVEMDKTIGRGLGNSTRWIVLQNLKRMGVKILTSTLARRIEPNGVLVTRVDGRQELLPAESVVIAAGFQPLSTLYEKLKDKFPAVFLVGDAKSVRTALEAVHEGFDTGYLM